MSRKKQVNDVMNTFGTNYNRYDKSMVSEGLQHWTGRGPACDLANDGTDMKLLKKKVQSFAGTKRGRGLHYDEGVKNQKSSRLPGPGEYETIDPLSMQGKLKQQLSRRSPMKAT